MVVPWICVSISKSQVIWRKPKKNRFLHFSVSLSKKNSSGRQSDTIEDWRLAHSSVRRSCSKFFKTHAENSDTFKNMQAGQWVDIIDHWSIIDHFASMVDILKFVVDITSKWSIFYQNPRMVTAVMPLVQLQICSVSIKRATNNNKSNRVTAFWKHANEPQHMTHHVASWTV